MRRFLVVGHRANSDGNFRLDDLPGTGGRMDTLALSASSALFLSHSLREDTEVWLVLLGGRARTLRIIGSEARYLFPDERNMAGMIRTALLRHREGKAQTPGMYVEEMSLEEAIHTASCDSGIFYLKEDGEDIRNLELPTEMTFVLGDNANLTRDEESILEGAGAKKVSLGKNSLHTYQAICVTNYEIDRRDKDGTGIL